MKYLLDTCVLIWAALDSAELSDAAKAIIDDENNELYFSPASIWEAVIKGDRIGIPADLLKHSLVTNGYRELLVSSEHPLTVANIVTVHKDPFDRLLLATAIKEGMPLLTSDANLIAYGPPVVAV
ncbi:MAG: type II toxin-antitoxin system VapC family toxin [Pseudomonas sp.]|uniref:type II toxin-antitoxin system VapC family toxin n=1 Tax=Pseudomonas sp. TaxID=306 RepID=UPI0030F0CA88